MFTVVVGNENRLDFKFKTLRDCVVKTIGKVCACMNSIKYFGSHLVICNYIRNS